MSKLQLSADTLAKIFQAQITKWNDAAIAADNPGVTLPDTPIVIVHRAEGSGTTSNFTGFLTKAAPTAWTLGKGDTVNWPTSTQAGSRQPGRRAADRQRVGRAQGRERRHRLRRLRRRQGDQAQDSPASRTPPASSSPRRWPACQRRSPRPRPIADLTFDPLNAAGATTYPIATPTWMLVYKNQTDKAKGEALKGFLNFLLTDGQALNEPANYAKLPASYRTMAIAQLKTLVIPA